MKISSKKINIFVAIMTVMLVFVLLFPNNVVDTYADDNGELNVSEVEIPDDAIVSEGDTEQSFTDAYSALEYVQNKINKSTGFKSVASSNLSASGKVPPFGTISLTTKLRSTTKVQDNGYLFCEDIVYTTPSMINASKGVLVYADTNNDVVFSKTTNSVSSASKANYGGGFSQMNKSEYVDSFGLLDDRLFIDVSRANIESGATIEATSSGYMISFGAKESSALGFRKKLYFAGGFDDLPGIENLKAVMQIDKYGNLIKVTYKMSCSIQKYIKEINFTIKGSLSGTITQTYSKLTTQDIVLPS